MPDNNKFENSEALSPEQIKRLAQAVDVLRSALKSEIERFWQLSQSIKQSVQASTQVQAFVQLWRVLEQQGANLIQEMEQAFAQWRRELEEQDPEYAEIVKMYLHRETETRHRVTVEKDGITATLDLTISVGPNQSREFAQTLKTVDGLISELKRKVKTEMGKGPSGRNPDPLPLEQVRYYRHIHFLIRRFKREVLSLPKSQQLEACESIRRCGGTMLIEFEDLFAALCADSRGDSPKLLALSYLSRKFSIGLSDAALEKKLRGRVSSQK